MESPSCRFGQLSQHHTPRITVQRLPMLSLAPRSSGRPSRGSERASDLAEQHGSLLAMRFHGPLLDRTTEIVEQTIVALRESVAIPRQRPDHHDQHDHECRLPKQPALPQRRRVC